MAKGEIRDMQLANLIAEEVGLILSSAEDSRLSQLAVTGVSHGGGAHYTVFVAPAEGSEGFSTAKDVKIVLERASGYLRSEVASSLNLKRAPLVTFIPDPLYGFGSP